MGAATDRIDHRRYTVAEYVQLEQYSNVRHEYVDGQIFALAGGTPEHSTYAANVIGILTAQLRGRPCRVQTSDGRIRVRATGLITYPDVSVVCGRAEIDSEDADAIVNPTLVVEVTSPSPDDYDRGEKLDHYQRIPALREILFVAYEEPRLDLVRRGTGGGWSRSSASSGASLRLESLDCEIAVDAVYLDPLRAS
ncbi:MAG: Uma2 family endonuclease [Thermoanaerobaculia bacterium]